MAKAATKKKPTFRHDVRYVFRGETRYGVVSMDKPKGKGNVVIDDSILPFRVEVPDDASVVDIESSLCSKDAFPQYDRMTGLLVSGGNDKDRWMNAEQVKAEALSKAAGKGVVVNKLFSIGVADGHATYVVTKVAGAKCNVEWRGFGNGDRYTDHFFGYGKKNVKVSDVARYIKGAEGMEEFFKKTDDRDHAVIESRPVGAIIHYVESRAADFPQFTRYEIVEQDGRKVGKFLGVCGKFPDWKLPHRTAWGTPHVDHDIQRKLDNPIVEKLCASYVYETATGDTADLKRSVLPDPAKLPLLDLTMPEATPEQVECGRLNDVVQAVKKAIERDHGSKEEFNSTTVKARLVEAWKLLKAELGD